eukprot:3299154-Prymnesium_polylepis.1
MRAAKQRRRRGPASGPRSGVRRRWGVRYEHLRARHPVVYLYGAGAIADCGLRGDAAVCGR